MGDWTWRIEPWNALTRDEAYRVFCLRDRVFVVGQKITEESELDGEDPRCHHVLMEDADGRCLGTARVFVDEVPLRVGRIAVEPVLQRNGAGTWMMEQLQAWLGNRHALMHAQAYLEPWYARLGWETVGPPFEEAGIRHVEMHWKR